MPDTITAGNILVEKGIRLPKSLQDQSEPNSNGWAAVKGARSAFVQAIQEAGWSFFFMAGEIKTTVFGFDRENALHAALKRLMADAKSQHCNSIEITQILDKSLWRVPYVSVSAHARHLQKGMCFSG
jgi:hypothetical protein